MIKIQEFDGNQRRHIINVRQHFVVWREDRHALRWMGGMHWKTGPKGQRYLYATSGRKEKSLGPQSPETDKLFAAHETRISELRSRIARSKDSLDRGARISKALYLGRVPTIAARILRKLDDEGLLGGALLVAGTNAIFAYEFGSGVLLGDALIATDDLDLLWDPRQRISLLMPEDNPGSVYGLLRQVDRSFRKRHSYQAINDDNYVVDLIRPHQAGELLTQVPRLSDAADELNPAAIDGLAWLVNSPRYEEVAIAEDGLPVRLVTIDPRAYALHKIWLSKKLSREALKRTRDFEQARTVARIAVQWLNLSFADPDLSALPEELMAGVPELEAEDT